MYNSITRHCLSYNKRRYITTSSVCFSSRTPSTKESSTDTSMDPDDQFPLQSMIVDESNMWENLESEIGDLTTFNLLKQHYEQRVQVYIQCISIPFAI